MLLDSIIPVFLDAFSYRDLNKVNELLAFYGKEFGTDKVRTFFLAEILSLLDRKALHWFWRASMTPEKYTELMESISTKAAVLLSRRDYSFGEDYSFRITQSGSRRLLLGGEAQRSLFNALPKERHSSLRLILPLPSKEETHATNSERSGIA